MKLGAHCVLYGDEIKTNTRGVIHDLAESGVNGCELGQRFFGIEDREVLQQALEASRMELSAMHSQIVSLPDFHDYPDQIFNKLETAARFMSFFPNKNVLTSPLPGTMADFADRTMQEGIAYAPLRDPAYVRTVAENMDHMAACLMEKYQVQLFFHNHNWEFFDNALIWRSIGKYAPHVMFALDCGWAFASGYDPISLMDEFPGRVGYVHLRDYRQAAHPELLSFNALHASFVDLGSGNLDYHRLLPKLESMLGQDGWAVIEYELGNFDKNSYVKAASYLRTIDGNL